MNSVNISKAIRCPSVAIETCWPAISASLKKDNIYNRPTILAALATIAVETAWKFMPIREFGNTTYFTKHYENRADLGNTHPGDGALYCGRGFVQITGRKNYDRYGKLLGVDLVGNPDLALTPQVAADILSDYFWTHKISTVAAAGDWTHVRRLVNGGTNGLDEFLKLIQTLQSVTEEDVEV
jgi:predicted chitinase